jgi:hypothetical protein
MRSLLVGFGPAHMRVFLFQQAVDFPDQFEELLGVLLGGC